MMLAEVLYDGGQDEARFEMSEGRNGFSYVSNGQRSPDLGQVQVRSCESGDNNLPGPGCEHSITLTK